MQDAHSHSAISQSPVWQALQEQAAQLKRRRLADLFAGDPQRASDFSLELPQFLLDFSKNHIDRSVFVNLLRLAEEAGLDQWRADLFAGEPINVTEGRPVLHPALRGGLAEDLEIGGVSVTGGVEAELQRLKELVVLLHNGALTGCSGKRITDVVNLGVGGSHLGPQTAIEALRAYRKGDVAVHFVSNVDGAQLTDVLVGLDAESTLFIVSSKTFTTSETMTNARSALKWLQRAAPDEAVEVLLQRHFVGVTASPEKAQQFGILPERTYRFWDWVGGRYSLWSVIGLPIAIACGFENFRALLDGAADMDHHFREAPFAQNAPVIMALLSVWYCTFMGYPAHAVLPYDQALHMLPAYLQQADMESNGKSTNRAGVEVDYATGPLIWGQTGINGQHAFYQYLHQSPEVVPADFIGSVTAGHDLEGHHEILLANMFAQSQALMNGVDAESVGRELAAKGLSQEEIKRLTPFKVHRGGKPSNTILLKELDPRSLGGLIALYEHKIFVQGVILQIYSFDQWGVELGKGLASKLEPKLAAADLADEDDSTAQLIEYYRRNKCGAVTPTELPEVEVAESAGEQA
ncbi:glucose-6-phosphate isomerase [Microbulbifer hydrolyticus]|uniref:Glucose-6-phosphate isomerase n=1 Tax=Microbulbifer hydrolyticus TaxID=48074 RepID=A0A6P1T6F3_9GAMM|nr:glucose-6-phosphate isomerase [Microbulbifer hydrolyticus]MBB5212809.1 glucose-6-phosphate isomerase [Microbulbifer hydrolyticus]QHQ38394.1 glucose-6-phosphate isomerase [Microbulbifer hydrolyticus]